MSETPPEKPEPSSFEKRLVHLMDPNTWFGFIHRKKAAAPGAITYASFHDRTFASGIDIGLTLILFYKLLYFLAIVLFGEQRATELYTLHIYASPEQLQAMTSAPGYWQDNITNSLLQILAMGALFVFSWTKAGMTPGKWLIRMRIVDEKTGRRLSRKQAVIRFLTSIVSALPFGLGLLNILWDKKNRAWHDKFSGTVVVKVKHWQLTPPEQTEYPASPLPESVNNPPNA